MNVISFSLWGANPKYVTGAIRNSELAPIIYPKWRCRFYCGASVPPDAIAALQSMAHVDVVRRHEPGDWTSMCWRFSAAADPNVAVAVFRDADSRLNFRERVAVDAWLAGTRDVHVMRDHPWHVAPIMGGMWGVRGRVLADIDALIARATLVDEWQVDQRLLADLVVPRVCERWIEHDEYFAGQPFPTRRIGRQFVGQPFDEHDRPLIEGPTEFERRARAAARPFVRALRRLARR